MVIVTMGSHDTLATGRNKHLSMTNLILLHDKDKQSHGLR